MSCQFKLHTQDLFYPKTAKGRRIVPRCRAVNVRSVCFLIEDFTLHLPSFSSDNKCWLCRAVFFRFLVPLSFFYSANLFLISDLWGCCAFLSRANTFKQYNEKYTQRTTSTHSLSLSLSVHPSPHSHSITHSGIQPFQTARASAWPRMLTNTQMALPKH
jgi:hypothetical protein